MHIAIASGYHTGSHRSWAEGYAASSAHEVEVVSLPGEFWQWRLTGGFVDLSAGIIRSAGQAGPPDVVLATSMVDVAGLRGMLAKAGLRVPIALYMHENQVTYPPLGRNRTERLYGLITWTSMLAADSVAMNSQFHRDELLTALPRFLGEFPDQRHLGRIAGVAEASMVLPVGVQLGDIAPAPKADPPVIVWNHRWDRDKDPAAFFRLMTRLADEGFDFRLALLGERFVKQRADHEEAVGGLADRVVVDGHLDRADYAATLGEATIVVSTAPQEFFGISVVEGMHAGAFPILPNRLVYPERIPASLADRCLFDSESHALDLLRRALADPAATRDAAAGLPALTSEFDWSVVAPRYDAWLASLVT